MIHAIWVIVLIIVVTITIILKSKGMKVWYNVIAQSENYNFVLEGYENNTKCFLFKIHKSGNNWSLLKDFSGRDDANEFLSSCLGAHLELLSDQEMGTDVPPPRILDLSPRRK